MVIVDLNKKEVRDEKGNTLNIEVEVVENDNSNIVDISNLIPVAIYGTNVL